VEYITGKITLRELFLSYWASYFAWYTGEIRAYGLFSNRLPGKLLPLARKALKQKNRKSMPER